jgi:hypothetical protein
MRIIKVRIYIVMVKEKLIKNKIQVTVRNNFKIIKSLYFRKLVNRV